MPRVRQATQLTCTSQLESRAWRKGYEYVAGCDEAGRGALLGPLFAAAVILDPAKPIAGLDDSKKLTIGQRLLLAEEIRAKAIALCVISVAAAEVDALNVYEASRRAMLSALRGLCRRPDFVLTDAMPLNLHGAKAEFTTPHLPVIHCDARSISIAAASILAKVERDACLTELDQLYPQYQLAKNKGYGTPEHLRSLATHGPCPEHRKTYQPVKDLLLPLFPFAG